MAEEKTQGQPEAAKVETTAEDASLIDEIAKLTNVEKTSDGFNPTVKGIEAFLSLFLGGKPGEFEKVDTRAVDLMIAEIDRKLSRQVDEVIHHPDFQKLESAWRGLKFTIDRTKFEENIKIELLNVSKDDLLDDFKDAPDITKSGLYKIVYTGEYGMFGGEPYGAMIANYEIGPGPQDLLFLQKVAAVGAMAHAPFFAAASPSFFGDPDYLKLPNKKDIKTHFQGAQFTKWQSFRESDDSRNVGLILPHFLLRLPYGPNTDPVKSFTYEEDVKGKHDKYLWGNAAFAFASRMTDSFAKYRWCPNIIGPQSGGAVEDLPLHQYEAMGRIETKIPTEVLISQEMEYRLSEEGFITLDMRKGSDNACFFSANSCQKPKTFGISEEAKANELNYRLGTQFPYMFIISRLAHYIKKLQTEQLGSWKQKEDLQRELNRWISQYVVEMDSPSPEVRSRCPLRAAEIKVEDVPGEAGWYKVGMKVTPFFKYMGAFFTLSLTGKLDKK